MAQRGFKIRALGEIAIRVRDMDAMVAFYRDTLGLKLLARHDEDRIVFFRISEGYGGHTAVLALFCDEQGTNAAPGWAHREKSLSSLHHIAFTVSREEQDAVIDWYEAKAVPYRIETFPWIGWRGIFTTDPEGNMIELAAYDETVLEI